MLSSGRLLSLRPFVWVGEISYSLYLWHWPIWVLTNYLVEGDELPLEHKLDCIVVTFVMAFASTKFVENPIRDKKKVRTAVLWRGFGIVWVALLLLLLSHSYLQVGGTELNF